MTVDEKSIRNVLASQADDVAVVDRLHGVPPYRVYEARLDGDRRVVKVDAHPRGHACVEGSVQRFVDEHTSVPVPPVVAVGESYFVAEWDQSVPQEGHDPDEDWARATGAMLATLHSETSNSFGGYGRLRVDDGHLRSAGHDDWITAARERIDYHCEYLTEVGEADVAAMVDSVLGEYPTTFEGCGDPVLCHGNALPDHVGVAGGTASSVIDFEHALVAPAEYDYWRTVTPLVDEVGQRSPLERSFREGYESVRSLPDGFERRRKPYALLNLVSYFDSLFLQDNHEPAERDRRAARMREIVEDIVDGLAEEMTE